MKIRLYWALSRVCFKLATWLWKRAHTLCHNLPKPVASPPPIRTIAQLEGPFNSTHGVVYTVLVAEGERRYRAKVVAPRLLTQPELDQRLKRILEHPNGSN